MNKTYLSFCTHGCPFGGRDRVCGQDPTLCPVNKIFRELQEARSGEQHCAYCSMQRAHPEGGFPANLCGSCGRYCPACDAPKD